MTEASTLRYTENPHTQINIYSLILVTHWSTSWVLEADTIRPRIHHKDRGDGEGEGAKTIQGNTKKRGFVNTTTTLWTKNPDIRRAV